MFTQNSPAFLYEPALARRVLKLIFGRLAFAILIFVAGWWWVPGGTEFSLEVLPRGSILFLPVMAVLTALYLFWLRFGRTLLWQIRAQFFIDTVLITWIVWQTGDLISPYITLYTILIGLAGFFLGKTDALAVAGACTFCFTALPFAINPGLIYSFSGETAPSRAVQTIAFNDVAFLLVGLLAARLADRRRIGEALKQAEANFANLNVLHERILASIKSGLITTDLNGKIYAFNRSAKEITGISPNQALGKGIYSIFGDKIQAPIRSCLEGKEAFDVSQTHLELTLPRPDSERQVTVSCGISPLVSAAGETTGFIIAFQDTTELRHMEETIRRSDRLAAVGRLAAGLAHEIRNPLGSMSSALQFLSAKAGKDDGDDALMDVVLKESDRLNSIITDFLVYARPGANDGGDDVSAEVDVGEAVADCLALVRHDPDVNEKHVFDFELPGNQVVMHADETMIKQIIWNLARNSIKSMPDGGRLSVELSEPAAELVRIVVSDTGHGIYSENIDKIFEPFHSSSGGTGLGLSIVHRIVTERGGRIDAKSAPGVGTTITIDLPK